MTDKAKAAEAKAKGNVAFQAKNYEEAIKHFTEAIGFDSSDHVFFSNRSACYASLEQYEKALEDGTECVRLKPDWPKGYTRKGLAQHFLQKYDDAAETYKAGLKLAPEDVNLKEGLKQAMDAKYDVRSSAPAGDQGSDCFRMDHAALQEAARSNPKVKELLQDKRLMDKFEMMMKVCATSPSMKEQMFMQMVESDPRILEVLMAMKGVKIVRPGEDMGNDMGQATATNEEPAAKRQRKEEPKKEEAPPKPEDTRTTEQREADEFKQKGNELYKQKMFQEAMEMYEKAIQKEPNDLTYYNNKCAVWIEMGPENYDQVLQTCKDLVNRRYEINTANPGGASFEKVAKVLSRMASVYEKRKEYTEAIEYYQKALTEDNNRHTRNSLREAERAKEKFEKESYIDPAKAEEHRQKGNDFFKREEWASAKSEYDEAVKRNPKDAKLYSNRAAALTKLLAYPDALRDLDECLKLDPTFTKAYSRKGAAHFFMKEYNKALQAYEQGLKVDPNNEECLKGQEQVITKIQTTSRSSEIDEEQLRHAYADPEIQRILHDPQINLFLKELQENPQRGQAAMRSDPKLKEAVSKLMAAGIVRVA